MFCAEQLLELHQGQGMDIYWRDAHICPSEEHYKEMVIRSEYHLFHSGTFLLVFVPEFFLVQDVVFM